MSLDLQPLICLSSCLFCLHYQTMANASPKLAPSVFLPAVGPWFLATLIFVKHMVDLAFKADFKADSSHSKHLGPLLIKARATVELR